MAAKFKVEDLVFAKIKGFPEWPARIADVRVLKTGGVQYEVFFFGTYERGIVKEHFIYPFDENEETLGKPRARGNFNEAMEEARSTKNLKLEEVVDKYRSPVLQIPPTFPPEPPVKRARKEDTTIAEADQSGAGGERVKEEMFRDIMVKAACGEYVKLRVMFEVEDEATGERLDMLCRAIEEGEYIPASVKRRIEERRENARKSQCCKPLFTTRRARNTETEFLQAESYIISVATRLTRSAKEYDGVVKARGSDESDDEKEERHQIKDALKEEMKSLLKEASDSEYVKRMSPLMLLKNPFVLEIVRQLKDGRCGDAISDATMPLYERLAVVFGLKEGQAFIKAYLLRKRAFDRAIADLPARERKLLTYDPTLFKNAEVKPWITDRMFPERFVESIDQIPVELRQSLLPAGDGVEQLVPDLSLVKPEPIDETDAILLGASVDDERGSPMEEDERKSPEREERDDDEPNALAENKQANEMPALLVPKLEPIDPVEDEVEEKEDPEAVVEDENTGVKSEDEEEKEEEEESAEAKGEEEEKEETGEEQQPVRAEEEEPKTEEVEQSVGQEGPAEGTSGGAEGSATVEAGDQESDSDSESSSSSSSDSESGSGSSSSSESDNDKENEDPSRPDNGASSSSSSSSDGSSSD